MPQPKLDPQKHRLIHECVAAGLSREETARRAGVSIGTVHNYAKRPLPAEAKTTPAKAELPQSWAEDYPPYRVDESGRVLILSDIHIPFHVPRVLEAAVNAGRDEGARTVILNGDVLDCHAVSRYPHDGTALTYRQELEYGRQFLAWLRQRMPKARIVFKDGNHDERLEKYVLANAPALFGVEDVTLASLLRLKELGIEHVGDQRVIHLGKLRVIHGHEYGGGVSAPVNPARWLMTRARKPAVMGHMHQRSEHAESDIDGTQIVTWSTGCLCGLNPKYRRLSARWNHGYCMVDVAKDGTFELDNRAIGLQGV